MTIWSILFIYILIIVTVNRKFERNLKITVYKRNALRRNLYFLFTVGKIWFATLFLRDYNIFHEIQ